MKHTQADLAFHNLMNRVLTKGTKLVTRNHSVYRLSMPGQIEFTSFPLVTLKKTAAKKAITEMEWFLSGNVTCPPELLDWWTGQLDPQGRYLAGYGQQLRNSAWTGSESGKETPFDQVQYLIDGIKNSPNSRRLCLTTWNPGDMANITKINQNGACPSACHLSFAQFFVEGDALEMFSYQRSGDLVLGVCHNWAQHYALLTYLAHQTGLKVGRYVWAGGDIHIYDEPSHLLLCQELNTFVDEGDLVHPHLTYTPTSNDFLAKDFKVVGEVPEPITKIRAKLL